MKYFSIIRHAERYRSVQPPPGMMEAMGELMDRYVKSGALVDTAGLATEGAFRMRLENGKLTTTDGPYLESKEMVGGWAILEASSHEEVLRFTTEFLDLHRKHWPDFEAECEIRPIQFLASDAQKAACTA